MRFDKNLEQWYSEENNNKDRIGECAFCKKEIYMLDFILGSKDGIFCTQHCVNSYYGVIELY